MCHKSYLYHMLQLFFSKKEESLQFCSRLIFLLMTLLGDLSPLLSSEFCRRWFVADLIILHKGGKNKQMPVPSLSPLVLRFLDFSSCFFLFIWWVLGKVFIPLVYFSGAKKIFFFFFLCLPILAYNGSCSQVVGCGPLVNKFLAAIMMGCACCQSQVGNIRLAAAARLIPAKGGEVGTA